MPSVIHHKIPVAVNDGISSAAIADKAQYDYYYNDTAESITSHSIVIDPESSTVMMATYDMTFNTTVPVNDKAISSVARTTTLYESPSAVITKKTTPHTLHFMQLDIYSSPSVLYGKNLSAITMTTLA